MKEKIDVLFVDDEQSILNALKRTVRKEPWVTLAANSGSEALELIESSPPRVIVTDMRMPGIDGAELLNEVTSRHPEIKQVLLTGYSDLESTVRAINHGKVSHYVSKPWENEHLKKVIGEALHEFHIREEYARLVELTQQQNEDLKELNENLEQKVAERTAALEESVKQLNEANGLLKSSYTSFVRVFAQFIQLRDARLSPNLPLFSAQVRLTAETLSIPEKIIDQLCYAAMLRNLGKLTLPDDMLCLPVESMSQEQKRAYRRHPLISQTLLLSIANLQEAATIIGAHQERINGRGFPKNLDPSEISLPAQVLGIVSDFHDLISGVLTVQRRSATQICDYIQSQSGKRYDAEVVKAFFKALDKTEAPAEQVEEKFLSTGSLRAGMVLSRDIFTPSGLFLLARDTKLTERVIEKIICFEKEEGRKFDIFVL